MQEYAQRMVEHRGCARPLRVKGTASEYAGQFWGSEHLDWAAVRLVLLKAKSKRRSEKSICFRRRIRKVLAYQKSAPLAALMWALLSLRDAYLWRLWELGKR